MMTRKSKSYLRPAILTFLILLVFQVSLSADDWIIAAQKFELNRAPDDSVSNALTSVLPTRILDNLGSNNFRTILKSEQNDLELYELKKNQNSFFLQLSSEIKKRDSLVLGKYSKKELAEKIADSDKKIKEIQESIQEEFERRKELEAELLKVPDNSNSSASKEMPAQNEYLSFFRNLFAEDEEAALVEKIAFYKNDTSTLFSVDKEILNKGYFSPEYEKAVLAASIRAVITGKITIYGDYISVSAEVYTYPYAKRIAAVTEVGTVSEVDFICASIARQLIPSLTNALPVRVAFSISPSNAKLYIDDVLQDGISEQMILDSGVHSILVEADGFKNAGTTYFFSGNNLYNIEINLQEDVMGKIKLDFPNITTGSFYANGLSYNKNENESVEIKINGENILGQFITEDGLNAFIYIPKENALAVDNLSVKPKIIDRNEYIEKHRRMMYTSYSALIVSLIPYFYTKGIYTSYSNAVNAGVSLDSEEQKKADIWTSASNISMAVSVGIGGWFIYELVRYFLAVDTVLPYEAKISSKSDYNKKEDVKKQKEKIEDEKQEVEE
ncbi:MAG: hypothetical protein K5829_10340 [Treponema sp.]|nr:hypothetical protein [Treponema sp.]